MIKKLNMFLLCIIFLILLTNKVNAATVGYAKISSASSSSSNSASSDPPNHKQYYYIGDGQYSCYYEYSISPSTTIEVNGYDMSGNKIMENSLQVSEYFKAGTWIGLNIKETKQASWSVQTDSFEYYETLYKYTCDFEYTTPITRTPIYTTELTAQRGSQSTCDTMCSEYKKAVFDSSSNTCYCQNITSYSESGGNTYYTSQTYSGYQYNKSFECPETYNGYTRTSKYPSSITPYEVTITKSEILNNVKTQCTIDATKNTKAEAEEYVAYSTNEVKYIKTNEYPENGKIDKTVKSLKGVKNVSETNALTVVNEHSGIAAGVWDFMPTKVCLNVKTSNVTYYTSQNAKCNSAEMDVTNVEGHSNYWRYFIPLNTKTNQTFYIKLEKNSVNDVKLSKEECYDIIKNYSDYWNYIKSTNGGDLTKNNKTKAKSETQKGCYFSTAVNFNVVQKFYNEETTKGTTTFKGFNFYYRPIDITNPFPNGVASNSLWNISRYNAKSATVNTGKNGTVSLSDSFSTLTYSTGDIDYTEVRNYSTTYTDWSDMNVNGSSKFVTSFLTRNKTSYYKLGCGPSNAGWGVCK